MPALMALRRAARASDRRMPRDSQHSAATKLQNEIKYKVIAGAFAPIHASALVEFSAVVVMLALSQPSSGLTLEPTCVVSASYQTR